MEHTRLHSASHYGDLEEVTDILQSNESVRLNSQNTSGYTPVHLAVCGGNLEVVRKLTAHGADVNLSSSGDNTPLRSAACSESANLLPMVQTLLRFGAGIDTPNWLGDTPLHGAAKSRDAKILRELLIHGADGRAVNGNGETVMHAVAESVSVETVRTLGEMGLMGVINAPCSTGQTPLHIASGKGHAEVCEWMVENGARVN